MKNIPKKIIIHHTGGTDANPLADSSGFTVAQCNDLHKKLFNMKSSLGSYVGYHYYIEKDGKTTQCRADSDEGAHTKGQNTSSLSVCLAGNFDLTTPTPAQIEAAALLVNKLAKMYNITEIVPHRKYANKTCYGKNLSDNWGEKLLVKDLPTPVLSILEEKKIETVEPKENKDMLQGKLTYTGIAISLINTLVMLLGLSGTIQPTDVTNIVNLIGGLIGAGISIYGRYRATKNS